MSASDHTQKPEKDAKDTKHPFPPKNAKHITNEGHIHGTRNMLPGAGHKGFATHVPRQNRQHRKPGKGH